jgi:uncharacterized protein DUF4432
VALPPYLSGDELGSGAHRLVQLGAGDLTVFVEPARGMDIRQIVHGPTATSVLWQRPVGAATVDPLDQSNASFYDRYTGGMQELFPNAGPACTVEDAPLPFHGEACRVGWQTTTGRDGASSWCAGTVELSRYPFRLERRIEVAGDGPLIRITARITNMSARALPVMWGFHPAFGPDIVAGGAQVYADPVEVRSHPDPFGARQVFPPGAAVPWRSGDPDVPGAGRLLPANSRSADLLYVTCESGWYAVRNEQTGLCAWMRWPADIFPYVWLWQECHDPAGYPWWGRHHIVGVEVHTSAPGTGLAAAVANGTARTVPAHGSVEAELLLGVGVVPAGRGTPVGVAADGTLRLGALPSAIDQPSETS